MACRDRFRRNGSSPSRYDSRGHSARAHASVGVSCRRKGVIREEVQGSCHSSSSSLGRLRRLGRTSMLLCGRQWQATDLPRPDPPAPKPFSPFSSSSSSRKLRGTFAAIMSIGSLLRTFKESRSGESRPTDYAVGSLGTDRTFKGLGGDVTHAQRDWMVSTGLRIGGAAVIPTLTEGKREGSMADRDDNMVPNMMPIEAAEPCIGFLIPEILLNLDRTKASRP